ncbi:MAG: hypothetical protein ACXABY_18630 [Candidatus Thorarchaeota archaeon]|jgi:hypothetical protein
MKTIGIIDADLLAGNQKRFPNLAAMKLSAWHKSQGDGTSLLSCYTQITDFDHVYLCCVFTDSTASIPQKALTSPHVQAGGTGFFYDKAKPLPLWIEHTTPDYALYSAWVESQTNKKDFSDFYYSSASIGFLTRGCFRRCEFCVNRNRTKATQGSPLDEFYDRSRERVCLLDDNFLAYKGHQVLLANLIDVCKQDKTKFEFKQGIDIRLLRSQTAKLLASPTRFGEVIFAFDSVNDSKQVRRGLEVLRAELPNKGAKAYVLCGFESQDEQDIARTFRRLEILWSYNCLGYIMPHNDISKASPICRRLYTSIKHWCNGVGYGRIPQRTRSFRDFCEWAKGKTLRSMQAFEKMYPSIAKRFFGSCYNDF